MPSVHKHPPIAYRPPQDVRDWLVAQRDEHGVPMSATITRAVRELRDRAEGGKDDPA